MAKIFITGSADGLGSFAAQELIKQGHEVVLHARNDERAKEALLKAPGAARVLVADLSNIEDIKALAADANALGRFDAVIHNVAVYTDASEQQFIVNCLAPYILTATMERPERLIYLSSDMHTGGADKLDNIASTTYSDSKLYDLLLTKAVARLWPGVYANAVHPGWVPTKMGGSGAPDNLEQGYMTQVWLATSDDAEAKVSGKYFYHQHQANYAPIANDIELQDKFLARCAEMSGIGLLAT